MKAGGSERAEKYLLGTNISRHIPSKKALLKMIQMMFLFPFRWDMCPFSGFGTSQKNERTWGWGFGTTKWFLIPAAPLFFLNAPRSSDDHYFVFVFFSARFPKDCSTYITYATHNNFFFLEPSWTAGNLDLKSKASCSGIPLPLVGYKRLSKGLIYNGHVISMDTTAAPADFPNMVFISPAHGTLFGPSWFYFWFLGLSM